VATTVKIITFILVVAVIIGLAALCSSFISPVDVLTGKERVVAEKQLPNGDIIQVVQYWNSGDFYNLDLRHTTVDGKRDRDPKPKPPENPPVKPPSPPFDGPPKDGGPPRPRPGR